MTLRVAIALVGLAATVSFDVGEAQPCGGPPSVRYVVRGEDGQVLDERELDSVHRQSTKPVGDDNIEAVPDAIFRAADGKYWGLAADGARTPALHFRRTTDQCSLRLVEVTLVHHDRRMRLIFDLALPMFYGDIDIFSGNRQRAVDVVVDSLPFSSGTFRLDRSRLAEFKLSGEQVRRGYPTAYPTIPADFWAAEP